MASRDLKVGLFVILSLVVMGGVVFLIGDERQLFSKRAEYRAAFKNVQGLSKGSPVRMGGVDIGSVDRLGYGKDAGDDTIYVDMSIVSSEAVRIRQDSIAEVKGKGLLGDKMIVISVGSKEKAAVAPGGTIETEETRDLEQIIGDLKKVSAGAERVIVNLETTTKAFADEGFHADIKETVANINQIMQSANDGEGYVGRILHDKGEADRISSAIESFRGSAAELEKLLSGIRRVVDRVQTGPGFVHEVIYEESGSQAISEIGGAAEQLKLALKGIRDGDSLASNLLYGEESGKMVENLALATEDLREIVKNVRAGKGTLGAFLVDPSVYDDIKVLLGNVGRNRSLRALVRYSIKQDDKSRSVSDGKSSGSTKKSSGAAASTASRP